MNVNTVNNVHRYVGRSQPKKSTVAAAKSDESQKDIKGVLTEDQKKVLDNLEKDTQFSELKLNQSMGRDQFMHILLAQLTNQNPLEPLKDQDFIAQMAQFSSLEELKSMDQRLSNFEESLDSIKKAVLEGASSNQNANNSEKLDQILAELKKISDSLNADKAKSAYE